MEIIIASENPGKIREIQAILGLAQITIKSLTDFPGLIPGEEDGSTYEENAFKKALPIAQATGIWTLADDSGLEVEALAWAPGLYSARYAGPECSPQDNMDKMLVELQGEQNRRAAFRCTMVLVSPEGKAYKSCGELWGEIAVQQSGLAGFGYDPIFVLAEQQLTLAELTAEEKNKISHRRQALEGMKSILLKF